MNKQFLVSELTFGTSMLGTTPQQAERDPENIYENDTDPLVNQTDSPPTYEALYDRLKSAKFQSSGFIDFLKTATNIVISTVGFAMLVAVLMVIPIFMIYVGLKYLYLCPVERYIPIYLVVGGAFAYFRMALSLCRRVQESMEDQKEEEEEDSLCYHRDNILDLFQFAWFIAGNVWVYRVFDQIDFGDIEADNYCHPTLYFFAFWFNTSIYIFLGSGCCFVCLGAMCARSKF